MSRIGKLPVNLPEGVEVSFGAGHIDIKGPKGQLKVVRDPKISYEQEENRVVLAPVDDTKRSREQYGLRRTLLNNAVVGVTKGFEKGLELVGVGYRVNVQGDTVQLNVGYSHPQEFKLPEGIQARVEGMKLFISGIDKYLVGEVAAQIRRIRPPEPYKGKGIKYIDERIRRKAGKSAKK